MEPVQRRLCAIIAADVVGYTRLVEHDTEGTVAAWRSARDEIITPTVKDHSGGIVKLTGDGFLAEFPTIQQAVACALEMQKQLEPGPLDFRMGINMGDVLDDGDDIHGEGVNIAARIEALAQPGGICISNMVYDAIRNRVDAGFQDLGEHNVKHVSAPVRVWHWQTATLREPEDISAVIAPTPLPGEPEKPSIAVLPFDSMSSDKEQEYFADGMSEDLITDLSKVSGLFVVARHSSFIYKGQSVDIRTVASELGVRFVLEGSIRKIGDRVRINAQLIEASTGGHVWAERYDGSLENVFELQDEVIAKVVSALSVQLTSRESDNLKRVHTHNLDAYELFVRARATPFPPLPERIESARAMFEQVIDMDPEFAGGYAGVSSMMSFGGIFGHVQDTAILERALEMAQKAISVDEYFGWSYTAMAMSLLSQRNYDAAIEAALKSIALQPNDADAHAYLGFILGFDGQYEKNIDAINQAIKLNPQFVFGPYLNMRVMTQTIAGDYAGAIDSFGENQRRGGPVGPPVLAMCAAAAIGLDSPKEATQYVENLKHGFPNFNLATWNMPRLIREQETRDRVMQLMREAGVPES